MSLYKSRRFAYLGFCCASILDALPYLQMLLTETHLENLHTETAKLFIDCEFFLTELKALAYFSHSVTFPLLNCVAVCSQKELCEIFPKLYHDLKNGLTTTLKKYAVSYRHIKITAPNTELDKTLIKLFCEHAADAVKLQCGREYGFSENLQPRGTELHKLSDAELADLPTDNVSAERNLAHFGRLSVVAKCRNKKFQTKGIRNDMTLYSNSNSLPIPDKHVMKIFKVLNYREDNWNKDQREIKTKRIIEKLEQAKRNNQYTNKLLQQCQVWKGPCSTIEQLQHILKSHPDISEKIVRTELSYYRQTHKADMILNRDLFKLNKISHEERLENFASLLTDVYSTTNSSNAVQYKLYQAHNLKSTIYASHCGMLVKRLCGT